MHYVKISKTKIRSLFLVVGCLSGIINVQGQEVGTLDSLEKVAIRTKFQNISISRNKVSVPKIKKHTVELIGSDNQMVVDLNGTIHEPLVDKNVNLLFKVTRNDDKATAEIPVTNLVVSGKFEAEGVNKKPFVIPSLREWHGGEGNFTLGKNAKIVLKTDNEELKKVANLLQEDLKKLLGINVKISTDEASVGDIVLTKSNDQSLGMEGYMLDIGESFNISAPQYQGSVFGTRTLLQLLEQQKAGIEIPRGLSRDYPTYAVRGVVFDVGRKYFTIDFLSKYVEFLSYYKLSNFQIHLNDNAFHKYFNFDWDKTPSGFRLENERYPTLASEDGHYTKKEFIELQEKAIRYGITIIPEIDVPAHSLAIVKAVPEIGSDKYGKDHLELSHPKTKEVVKNIFEEYITGPNPVFVGKEVHIGTDEYDKHEAESFRDFTDFLIKTVQNAGKDVRAWGALTHAQGTTPVTVENVMLNMWYNGYADPIEMKKLGYKQISTPDGWLYIVPAAGYYYDYLNTDHLYNNWEPRHIGNVTFEKGDPTVVGGMFAIWNDIAGNGISEKDAHNRVFPATQILAEKMWSASDDNPSLFRFNQQRQLIGEGPGLNIRGHFASKNPLLLEYTFEDDLKNVGALDQHEANATGVQFLEGVNGKSLYFEGSQSSLELPIPEIGEDYTISFWIKPDQELTGTLFQSENAQVFADENTLGYKRDGYTFEINKKLAVDQWSQVIVTGDKKGVQFFINGKLAADMSPEEITLPYKDQADKEVKYLKTKTLVFPLEKITLPFSHLDNFKVFNKKFSAAEIKSEYQSSKK